MFTIKFRIVDCIDELKSIDITHFNDEYNNIEGFFQICIGQNYAGSYYHENPLHKEEIGGEYINYWLNRLLDTVNCLSSDTKYVAFKDLETFNRWIEFKRIKDTIHIKIAIDTNMKCNKLFITNLFNDFDYVENGECRIGFAEFKKEVSRAMNSFFHQLKILNPNLLKSKMALELSGKF